MKNLLIILLSLVTSNFAFSSTQCGDWSKQISFEDASREYMNLAIAEKSDFGCISRAAFMSIEDLFQPANRDRYEFRLKSFDEAYRKSDNLQARKAFDEIKILFQLRWLSENYEEMKNYNSSKVIKGVAGATAATAVMAGAAVILHNPALLKIEARARPAMIRMFKYLGAMVFARVASANTDSKNSVNKLVLTTPPLDLIGGATEIYWNYTDLHLMRDLATITAETVAAGTVQATVAILALRYLGAAAAGAGFFSAGSLAGFIIGYPVGKLVGHMTETAITNRYHTMYGEETIKLKNELKATNLTDWERYIKGSELTSSAITWVSTQDMYLQNSIESKIISLSQWQICARLRHYDVAKLVMSRHRQYNIPTTDLLKEGIDRINHAYEESEAQLKVKIYMEIEEKRKRLLEVRQGVLSRMLALEKVQKNYMKDFIVRHRVLLDRLDRYLNHDAIIVESLNVLNKDVQSLSADSAKWNDATFLGTLKTQNRCL